MIVHLVTAISSAKWCGLLFFLQTGLNPLRWVTISSMPGMTTEEFRRFNPITCCNEALCVIHYEHLLGRILSRLKCCSHAASTINLNLPVTIHSQKLCFNSPMAAKRIFFFSAFSSFDNGFLKPNFASSAASLSFSARCAASRSSKLLTLQVMMIRNNTSYTTCTSQGAKMGTTPHLDRKNCAVRRTAVRSPVGTSTPICTIAWTTWSHRESTDQVSREILR